MTLTTPEELDATSAATMAVLQSHMRAMSTMDPAVIAADYAEDCVVHTSFAEGPVVGRQGVEEWVETELPAMMQTLGAPRDGVEPVYTLTTLTANGEYGYLVVDLQNGAKGTETYHCRDGEILFESATFFL
ncbi:MAG: hypothetical protein QM809_16535 [Gordonia sp. (in: high G+C Gram-positive bacteria)]|uniref:hypothetical protein n=1 Tax=Gordonia sp. (in: high G+C Gram-positive bacteria) TaxID=84139 RepID=UPI0039E59C70